MSAMTLVRFGLPLLIGAVIGGVVADVNHEKEQDRKRKANPTLSKQALRKKIKNRAQTLIYAQAMEGETLEQHLASVYHGLYCLGRVGYKLNDTAAKRLMSQLAHWHRDVRVRRDRSLSEHYFSHGAPGEYTLAELLADCPITKDYDTRYIAAALGEKAPALSFDGWVDEMVDEYVH